MLLNSMLLGEVVESDDCTALPSDIRLGKTAVVGEKIIEGTMPTAGMNIKSISLSDTGTISAKVEVHKSGYMRENLEISRNVKYGNIQEAAEYTPGTEDQIISYPKFLTGDQIIKGDSNLLPENIRKGVSIFGVEGTMLPMVDSFSKRVNSMINKLQPAVTDGYTVATTYSYGEDDTSFGGIYVMDNSTLEWTHPNSSYTTIQYCKSLPNGVVVGMQYRNSASFVYSTNNGKSWSAASVGVTFDGKPVLMSNGSMIAIYGINTSDVYYVTYTTNGSSWTTKNLGSTRPYQYINGDEVSGYFYGGNITTTTTTNSEGTSYYNYHASYYRTKDFNTWERVWNDVYLGNRKTTANATHTYTCQGAYQFGNIHLIFAHQLYTSSSNNRSGTLYFTYSLNGGSTWSSIEGISSWIDNYGSSSSVAIDLASIVYHKNNIYLYHPYYDDKTYNNPEYYVLNSSGLTSKSFSGTVKPYCISSTGDKVLLYYENIVDYFDEL